MPLRFRQEVQALPRQAGESLSDSRKAGGRAWPLRIACLLAAAIVTTAASPIAAAASNSERVGQQACSALLARVNAIPGAGPVFLRSYDAGSGAGEGAEPALNGAFTYDNALAAIALQACGEGKAAARIGDALLLAAANDRSGTPGRLRNAYRPGRAGQTPVPPMGWWSAPERRWDEDAYQTGSSAGNTAWAALALLTLAEATNDPRYLESAAEIAHWTIAETATANGFTGGLYGYDDAPQRLTWKSTEQNTDLAAVFDWLARLQPDAGWQKPAAAAQGFVAAQWQDAENRFRVGTLPDGTTPNTHNSGLDAELWPLLLRDAPDAWRGALATVERAHRVGAGFDFNDDGDGVWWEGTAQAALVYRAVGLPEKAEPLLGALAHQFSAGGLIWATDRPRITTGLALSPASTTDDFYYYRLPHLGATAWAALAARGWNPFTGKRVADPAP